MCTRICADYSSFTAGANRWLESVPLPFPMVVTHASTSGGNYQARMYTAVNDVGNADTSISAAIVANAAGSNMKYSMFVVGRRA